MMQRMALSLAALMLAAGCASDVSSPESDATTPAVRAASSPRSGALNVEKECSTYTGQAGDTCTITKSNVKEIEVGSTITYAQGASADGTLSSDIVLDPPRRGNNQA